VHREQTTFVCCAGIPKHHQKADHLSSPLPAGVKALSQRDGCENRPLRYRGLLPPPRKLRARSFDVTTEFTLFPTCFNSKGFSISCSYGNTVGTGAIHREQCFSRRLALGQRQGTGSSQQPAKLLPNQRLSHGCTGQIPTIALHYRAEERESRKPAFPRKMRSYWREPSRGL